MPDHSTIYRRLIVKANKEEISGKILIVDSTGFRLGRATEYVEYRHKLRSGKKIVRFEITPNFANFSALIYTCIVSPLATTNQILTCSEN